MTKAGQRRLVQPAPGQRRSLRRDLSVSAVVAGFVAVVVSYSGPMVVVLTAAANGHLTAAQTTTWVWAISIGSGTTCILLSWWTRQPVITAWSTPGAALLVTSLAHYGYKAAIGAYLLSAVAVVVTGVTGLAGWFVRRVPGEIVSAMLAGILFPFGVDLFRSMQGWAAIPLVVFATFLVVRTVSSRYAVLVALVAGVVAALIIGKIDVSSVRLDLAQPLWTAPDFDLSALVGLGVPLFIVTMASQNATGLGVMTSSGYQPDDRKLIVTTGVASAVLAPLGSHAINLAAITAAICTGPEANPDPKRRYPAGIACGVFYVVIGLFGAALVSLFTGLPSALVAAIAGVALLSAFTGGLAGAIAAAPKRDAAVVTFLVTASDVSLAGIGSAFWGLLFGLLTHGVGRWRDIRVNRRPG